MPTCSSCGHPVPPTTTPAAASASSPAAAAAATTDEPFIERLCDVCSQGTTWLLSLFGRRTKTE